MITNEAVSMYGNYFTVPNVVLMLGLSPGAIAVYNYLSFRECRRRGDKDHYTCYPSMATIGRAIGRDRKTVAKYVDELVEAGLTKSFGDVTGGEWYADSVAWAASHEVMNGMGDGDFSPGSEASRAQIAQLLFNLDGATADGNLASFGDVNAGDWYADAVTWMVENGIASGMGDGFGANEDVTREQLAVMLYNYARYKGYDTTMSGNIAGFPDAGSVDGYARSALAWAVGVGLINGTTDSSGNIVLDPQGSATRAQIASIVERFCEKVAR